jgi:hypothetical protein
MKAPFFLSQILAHKNINAAKNCNYSYFKIVKAAAT